MEHTRKTCVVCDKHLSAVNRTGYCRQHYAKFNNSARTAEQNRRQWQDPDMRERLIDGIRRHNRSRVAWCPLEYRGEYHRLKRTKHCAASEARQLIEELMQADAARYVRTGQLQQARRAG